MPDLEPVENKDRLVILILNFNVFGSFTTQQKHNGRSFQKSSTYNLVKAYKLSNSATAN